MKNLFTLLCSVLFFTGIALAQPGALDTTFNRPFNANGIPYRGNGVQEMLIQPDGKIVIDYYFTDGSGAHELRRLNKDGSIDESFNRAEADVYAGNILLLH